jgi:hypothetical protein
MTARSSEIGAQAFCKKAIVPSQYVSWKSPPSFWLLGLRQDTVPNLLRNEDVPDL